MGKTIKLKAQHPTFKRLERKARGRAQAEARNYAGRLAATVRRALLPSVEQFYQRSLTRWRKHYGLVGRYVPH